jgi:Protein of unknown function, DUF538
MTFLLAVVVLLVAGAPIPILCDTAHDLLAAYGLPWGLLPDAVKRSYISDDDDGDGRVFEVKLSSSSCYVHFPSNLIYYHATISGRLSNGRITGLSGIQAKKLFVWVPFPSNLILFTNVHRYSSHVTKLHG